MIDKILNKIDELRQERNWSVYKLACEAELSSSAIANMYSRKTYPSLPTLIGICNAFGITLGEFFQTIEKSTYRDTFEEKCTRLSDEERNAIEKIMDIFYINRTSLKK